MAGVLLAGCGSQPPTAAPTTGPQGSALSPSASARPGPAFDPTELRTLAAKGQASPDQLGAAAASLGSADRSEVNAATVIGPAAAELQALMDKTDEAALEQLGAKLGTAAPGTSPSPQPGPGSPSPSASTGADTGAVELAAYRGASAPGAARPATALLTTSFALMMGMGSTAVQLFDPKTDASPTTQAVDQESTSGGASMSVHATITWGWAAGEVSVSIDLSGSGTKTDPTSGAVSTMTGSTQYSVKINPCPNRSGGVETTIDVNDDESFTAGGKTVGYKYDGFTGALTQVDMQAEIESTLVDDNWTRSTTTQGADANSDATSTAGLSGSSDYDPSGKAAPGGEPWSTSDSEGSPTTQDYQELGKAIGLFGDGAAIAFGGFARSVWRSGRCFEVRPQPNGGPVGPSSQTAVTVSVYHWVDKADISAPVKATLAGTQKIDPANTAVDSPAKFTFTAGTPGSTGVVTYKVVSDRGIGERSSTFVVQSGLKVNLSGTLNESAGPVTYKLKIAATGIGISVAQDGTVTASGTATVTGTAAAAVCKGRINERIRVQGTGTVTGTPDAPVYRVLIGPASTQNLGGSFSCPFINVTSNAGDFFGQWSTTIGPVDYPAAGGTFTKSGTSSLGGVLTRNATGSYVATPATK